MGMSRTFVKLAIVGHLCQKQTDTSAIFMKKNKVVKLNEEYFTLFSVECV